MNYGFAREYGRVWRSPQSRERLSRTKRKGLCDEPCIWMDGRGDVDLDGDRRTRGGFTGRRDQQGVREIGCVPDCEVT